VNRTAEQGRSERDTATGRLLQAYRQDGDIRARDRLVALYLPLVESFAQRYARPGAEYDDLVQAGSIGLLNAIERFDSRRGDEFAAFAVPTIVGEMKRHIRDRAAIIKLPRQLQDASAQLPRVQEELTARLERQPSEHELAHELGLEPDEFARLREFLRAPAAGDDTVDGTDDDLDASDERVMLAGAFRVLDEDERSIVYLRFVRDLGTVEVASELGITERQLSRRTQVALGKLRGELERGGAPPASPRPPTAVASTQSSATMPTPPRTEDARKKGGASGRLLLRMPQSLHAELTEAAEHEAVSLNQFITNSLAAALAWRQPRDEQPMGEQLTPAHHDPAERNPTRSAHEQAAPPRWLRLALIANVVVVGVAALAAVALLLVAWHQGW
jgi:RNA polymerase sigma-B factor